MSDVTGGGGTIMTRRIEAAVAEALKQQMPVEQHDKAEQKAASVGVGLVLMGFGLFFVVLGVGLVVLSFFVLQAAVDKWLVGFAGALVFFGVYLAIKGASGASGEGLDVAKEMTGLTGIIARFIPTFGRRE